MTTRISKWLYRLKNRGVWLWSLCGGVVMDNKDVYAPKCVVDGLDRLIEDLKG